MIIDDETTQFVNSIKNNDQNEILNHYNSKVFGWLDSCIDGDPEIVEKNIHLLGLDESDTAAIMYSVIESALEDLDEHEDDSQFSDDEKWLDEQLEKWDKKRKQGGTYSIEVLQTLAEIRNGKSGAFYWEAIRSIENEKTAEYLKGIENLYYKERADAIIGITDFSAMSPLCDEIIAAFIALSVHQAAETGDKMDIALIFFDAFEYYIGNRPFPVLFGTKVITSAVKLAVRLKSAEFGERVVVHLDKIVENVSLYTNLSNYYALLNDKENAIKYLKLAYEYGADDWKIDWLTSEPWCDDEDVLAIKPISLSSY